jgi:hypothetical protein
MNAEGVSAVSWAPGRLDVFAVGGDQQLKHWWWDGNWGGPQDLGGNMRAESVSAVSWAPGRLDIFAVENGSGQLLTWAWDGNWHGPVRLGGNMNAEGVSAVSGGPGRLDVFGVQAGPGQLLRWWWDGKWHGPVPLGGNLPAWDVCAVRRSSGIDVFATGPDYTLQHWPSGAGVPNEPWENWAGILSITPRAHCHPASLEELVAIVQEAERKGLHVRASGSRWSFSDVAMTPDCAVETDQLCGVLSAVLEANPPVLNGRIGPEKLIHVEAGIKLQNLMTILDAQKRAPHTMGGSDGQSLAGALSTCVHGSDFDRGPLPEMVRAIHLVGPGGIQYWIEPSQPITDATRLRQTLGIDPANIHYLDSLFNAVLVSVGTLGIIYSLIIEVEPQYDLVETCTHLSWPDLRQALANESPFAGNGVRCVQAAIDPAPPHPCFLITRQEARPPQQDGTPNGGVDPLGLFCQSTFLDAVLTVGGPGLLALLHAFLQASPLVPLEVKATVAALPPGAELVPGALVGFLRLAGSGAMGDFIGGVLNSDAGLTARVVTFFTGTRLPAGTKRGLAHTIMAGPNPGECAFRGRALEVAFSTAGNLYLNYVDAALAILDQQLAKGFALGGYMALRFVGPSRAYLSPHRSARTCTVEVTGLRTLKGTKTILDLLESAARDHGGIPHWGMCSNLTAADVARAYPNLSTWLLTRWSITKGGTLTTFDSDFSLRCGLSERPASVLGAH